MSTINTILIKRRLESSALTTIPTLSGGELAYSEKNHTLYYGGEFGTLTIAGSGAFVDVLNTQTISGPKTFTNTTTISGLTVSGSSTLDFGSNVLTNLGTPANDADATTKLYVDTLASAAATATDTLSSHVDTYFVEKIESDAVVLNGGLTVTNGLSSDTIYTSSNAQVGGNLRVAGNLEVLGDTTVIETTTTTTSSFAITNYGTDTALQVTQVDGTNDVAVFNDAATTALIIKGDGNVGIGTATPNEKLTITGNISATGNIYADGQFEVNGGGVNTTLFVEDGMVGINTETPNEALTVVGNISASQNIFAVNGDFTGTLDADGATTLGSTLYVTGAATFASSVSAAGAVDFDSTLNVDGAATFASTVSAAGAVDFDSTLNVDGAVDFDSTLNVDGAATFASSVSAAGAVDFDSTLNVDGATTLGSTVSAAGAASFGSNLQVTGTTSLDGGTITTDGAGSITGSSGVSQLINFIIDGGSF
jgi:cytoskeletal protein CcmA (bactofilin family)